MSAYYNEIEPYCAQWLRNLIAAGLIAPGDVDERSIVDVRAGDLRGYDQCHFFAGIGGWSRALQLADWPMGRRVWSGSCPCQPFSAAGRGRGVTDERHLWPHWFRLIAECRPPTVFGEQVINALAHGWLDACFDDLEAEGYACAAAIAPAASVGAPHIRDRAWFVADADCEGLQTSGPKQDGTNGQQSRGMPAASGWWSTEPALGRMAHGVPNRVGRLRAYGNAIVPQVAAEFISAYLEVRNDE